MAILPCRTDPRASTNHLHQEWELKTLATILLGRISSSGDVLDRRRRLLLVTSWQVSGMFHPSLGDEANLLLQFWLGSNPSYQLSLDELLFFSFLLSLASREDLATTALQEDVKKSADSIQSFGMTSPSMKADLVAKSAGFNLPGTNRHSSGRFHNWISPIRFPVKGL